MPPTTSFAAKCGLIAAWGVAPSWVTGGVPRTGPNQPLVSELARRILRKSIGSMREQCSGVQQVPPDAGAGRVHPPARAGARRVLPLPGQAARLEARRAPSSSACTRASGTSRSYGALPDRGAPVESRPRGARHRRDRHLRAARGGVRLHRRPREPRRLHGPLHVRLQARAGEVRRARRGGAVPAREPGAEAVGRGSVRPPSSARAGSSRKAVRAASRRNRFRTIWDLSPEGEATRVELTFMSRAGHAVGRLQGGPRRARVGQAAEQSRAGAAQKGVRGAERQAAGACDRGRPGAGDTASLRRPSEPEPAQGQGIDCRARWASAVSSWHSRAPRPRLSLSGCFLEEEKEEGEPLREGLAVKVGGIEYTVFITRELNPSLPGRQGLLAGRGGEAGVRALRRLHPGVQPQRR